MKHAQGIFKTEEYQENLKYDNCNEVENKQDIKVYKLINLIINIILLFVIFYLYNQYISNINQLSQNIKKIIYFIFIISSIYLILATNYILWNRKYKLEKLFLIVMIPVSICYSLLMIHFHLL